jgi:hypothetical protein
LPPVAKVRHLIVVVSHSGRWVDRTAGRGHLNAKRRPVPAFEAHKMFLQRFYDYDLKSYPRGYYFNFLGLVRILKFKTNTVMEKDNWIFIIEVLGREYVLK